MYSWNNFSVVENFPWSGYLYVYVTADVVTTEPAENGDADRRGYVSDAGATDLTEYRNDVSPALKAHVVGGRLSEDDHDALSDLIERLGAWHSCDGFTLYASDSVTHDYATDETWNYAIHGTRKFYRDGVAVEDSAQIVF